MKINEVTKPIYETPSQFVPTHFGGPMGLNLIMHAADGNLYFEKPREQGGGKEIVRWNGNPSGEGFFGKWNPATIKGIVKGGQKIPYPAGQNFTNAPSNQVGKQGSSWQDPDAKQTPQAAKPVTGASYDQGLLRRGSKGAGVKELQKKLGMPESEQDGMFGPKTEAAVKKLQQSQGIKVDGIVGPETRATIEKLAKPEDKSATVVDPPVVDPNTTGGPEPEQDTTGGPEPEQDTTDTDDTTEVPPANTPDSIKKAQDEITPDLSPEDTEEMPDPPVTSGVVDAETIQAKLSDFAKKKFDDQLNRKFKGDLLKMLVDAKKQTDDFWQQPGWKKFYQEVFGITITKAPRKIIDVPGKGVIDINSVPDKTYYIKPSRRGAAYADERSAANQELLAQIKYKNANDVEESRILDLAGVNMKKKLDEASINISGADASEVSEILRMMQLAGAPSAKIVGPDDINPSPKPMPMPSPGGCGSDEPEGPGMGDMIRMMSDENVSEEDYDGNFQDATTEPGEEYMDYDASTPAGNDLHKEKGTYKHVAGGDNPMQATEEEVEESIKAKLMKALESYKDRDYYDASEPGSKSKITLPKMPWDKDGDHDAEKDEKPDYADLDGDGNEDESMSDAAKDKSAKDKHKEKK